jgi:hypothetical protein
MRKLRWFSAVAALTSLALASCGGGGCSTSFANGCGSSTTTGSAAASITLTADVASIPADGSSSANITALVKDANNNAVSAATVTFSSDAGSLVVGQATTDASGVAKAALSASGAAAGSSITVTAKVGTVSSTLMMPVVNAQQTISVITSLPQIPSDSSQSATITALVRGANNQFLPGVAVTFTASSGGLQVTQGTTDASGAAKATLNAAGDQTNRTITVTATAGTATATVPVDVQGTKLTLSGPANLVSGASGTYTVSLTDSSNAGIPNKVIALTSSAGNTLSSATVTTDPTGQKTFILTGVKGGSDTLTASVLGLSAAETVQVSAQNFAINPPASGATIFLNTPQTVTLTWTISGVAQVGKTIAFATTRGTLSAASAVTDASGVASVSVSSTISGPAVISASSSGATTQTNVDFVATTPASIAVQASPTTIPTQGSSTIVAVVRDAQNNLVEGQTVDFTTVNDITGGTFSVASALTDVQGQAKTVYNASATPSSSNGVTVQAAVQGFPAVTPAQTKITVGGQTVFLSLGTGNKISENAAKTQFIVPYSVQSVDSAGHAIGGVAITLTIHSVLYGKGFWYVPLGGSKWVQTGTPAPSPITVCPNEDANLNGVLEPLLGEDVAGLGNNNGVLDPGEIAATSPGSVTTDNTGSASFNVIYPEDHAGWVESKLTATTTVTGTESSTSATFWLPMLGAYVADITNPVPGVFSPYGMANVCTDPN